MCAITGIYTLKQQANTTWVQAMNNSLGHRGPDADGLAKSTSGYCILGHRRLSIIDLSTGANQPMQSACGKYTMVFNGEVYNFNAIKKDIEKYRKIEWKTNSDSEVILEAFATWGKQFVYKLNGMFAVAIFDNENEVLWLFRDRIGIKPIYYFWDKEHFVFASELKAINQLKEQLGGFSINRQAVGAFLRLGYIPTPHTIYNEVKKMPSGSFMAVTQDGLNTETYWDIRKKVAPKTNQNEQEAKTELKKLIQNSVSQRLISDVPFGTFLSGGIDSSTVTAVAQSVSSKPINTFSIAFEEAKYNEAKYASQVAKHLKTNHHELMVSYTDALAQFDRMLTAYDEPFADSSAIPTMLVSKLAKEKVTMTLSGDGGDEQFLGYGMYTWANRLNKPLVHTLRKPIAWALDKSNNRYKRASALFRYTKQEELPAHIFSVEQYLFSAQELNTILQKEYQHPLNLDLNPKLNRKLSVAENQAFFDLRYYLQDDLLVKVDRASMQFSLETRVPLLDHNIIEFSLNLDESLKQKNKTSKYLLKEVLYDYVPKKLFERPKWGFSIPLRQWLKNELSYLRKQYLSKEILEKWQIFDVAKVLELEQRFLNGEDFLYNKLWLIIVLNSWLEKNA